MSSAPLHSPGEIGRRARRSAIDAAWRQWTALGASGGGNEADGTTIDPEALVLASSQLVGHERRLGDFLLWWAGVGATLLSVQRTRTLLKATPEAADALAPFAASAVGAGDRRWKGLAGSEGLDARPGKGVAQARLTHPMALVLRLRAAFGVSAKADVVAVLLGLRRGATVREVAEATGYTTVAVRGALGGVALAGFAEATGETPTAYRATRRGAWGQLLGGGPSAWGHWSERYAALLDVAAWGERAEAGGWSEYVAASKARDLTERHARAFRRWAPAARLGGPPDEAALPAFGAAVDALTGPPARTS
jgi:hypothetical protein